MSIVILTLLIFRWKNCRCEELLNIVVQGRKHLHLEYCVHRSGWSSTMNIDHQGHRGPRMGLLWRKRCGRWWGNRGVLALSLELREDRHTNQAVQDKQWTECSHCACRDYLWDEKEDPIKDRLWLYWFKLRWSWDLQQSGESVEWGKKLINCLLMN